MIMLLGGAGTTIALSFVQMMWHIALPVWLNLVGMGCAAAGILYAYTRRCPGCGAGGVVTMWGPHRSCDECGTMFLNDRFF
jgi:hypothetical protein